MGWLIGLLVRIQLINALLIWLVTHEWSLSLAPIVIVSLIDEELVYG